MVLRPFQGMGFDRRAGDGPTKQPVVLTHWIGVPGETPARAGEIWTIGRASPRRATRCGSGCARSPLGARRGGAVLGLDGRDLLVLRRRRSVARDRRLDRLGGHLDP